MATKTNVWQRHSSYQTREPFRIKTLEDDLNSTNLLPNFHKGTRNTKTLSRNLHFLDKFRKHHHHQRPRSLIPAVKGEGYRYYTPEEEIGQVWYVGYYSDGRRASPDFEIPEVWGGNKR